MIQNRDKRNTKSSKTSSRKKNPRAETHQVPSEYEDKFSYFKGERAVEQATQRVCGGSFCQKTCLEVILFKLL